MLVEFSVENHRAFRERQVFSMVASRPTEHTLETGTSSVPYVLPQTCLFGANGAGKSSLIGAMQFMQRFVDNFGFDRADFNRAGFHFYPKKPEVEPFLFHSEWRDRPSEFEAIFLHEETLYQYGFSLTRERVVEEWLFARPNRTRRQRHLFTRCYDGSKGTYDWSINSVHLKGPRESWKEQTREDALFLSTAVYLNSEELKKPYAWFADQIKMMDENGSSLYTLSRFKESGWSRKVIEFLKRVDVSLTNIDVRESNPFESEDFLKSPVEIQKAMRASLPDDARQLVAYSVREDEKGEPVALNFDEESSGTQSLLGLTGPILDTLENGYVLVVDELNSSLHPLAFQALITLFSDPQINKKKAQLIFTTHDSSVTEGDSCIGHDQIWLVNKGTDLAAKLVPYSDFKKVRSAPSFQKGYLQGRYGGIPRIERWRWHHNESPD